MKAILGLILVLGSLNAQASDVQVLKSLRCVGSGVILRLQATYTPGDRIAVLDWVVRSSGRTEQFMSALQYQDSNLSSFGGSTLGSDVTVSSKADGSVLAELVFRENSYSLFCK